MKVATYIWMGLLALNIGLLGACSSSSEKKEKEGTASADRVEPVDLSNYFIKTYKGQIGDDLPISFTLINFAQGNLTGWYSYDKIGKRIDLQGESNLDESFYLEEYTEEGATGKFRGSIANLSRLEGQWQNQDSSKVFDFVLEEVEQAEHVGWAGAWHLNDVWDGGTLLLGNVNLEEKTLDFALDFVRNTHFGAIQGTAVIKKQRAIFSQPILGNEEKCELAFMLKGDHIEVEQNSSPWACGFGMRAYAGGRYDNKVITIEPEMTHGQGEETHFNTPAQHEAFKTLTGDFYETFAFNMQHHEKTPQEIPEAGAATYQTEGWIYGMMQTNKAIVLFDEQNQLWAATQDSREEESVIRYFTNTKSGEDAIPAAIMEWRKDIGNDRLIVEKMGE
ncbi:MAG: hypothetical protein AAGG75_17860 [Bacteroidota bacterium]